MDASELSFEAKEMSFEASELSFEASELSFEASEWGVDLVLDPGVGGSGREPGSYFLWGVDLVLDPGGGALGSLWGALLPSFLSSSSPPLCSRPIVRLASFRSAASAVRPLQY